MCVCLRWDEKYVAFAYLETLLIHFLFFILNNFVSFISINSLTHTKLKNSKSSKLETNQPIWKHYINWILLLAPTYSQTCYISTYSNNLNSTTIQRIYYILLLFIHAKVPTVVTRGNLFITTKKVEELARKAEWRKYG